MASHELTLRTEVRSSYYYRPEPCTRPCPGGLEYVRRREKTEDRWKRREKKIILKCEPCQKETCDAESPTLRSKKKKSRVC